MPSAWLAFVDDFSCRAADRIALFRERVATGVISAAVLMGIGVWLHLSERHEHEHEHEHRHEVMDPNMHTCTTTITSTRTDPITRRYPIRSRTHIGHHHAPMTHTHPYYPNLHHRHGHG